MLQPMWRVVAQICEIEQQVTNHPRLFDEQLGPAVGALDYVRGSGN